MPALIGDPAGALAAETQHGSLVRFAPEDAVARGEAFIECLVVDRIGRRLELLRADDPINGEGASALRRWQ